jgi:prepilin-type N-terminal cleavage/methylation domain-containing protein
LYSSSPSLDRRGFTLAELMISLVLGALIIGVVLQFVSGQTRLTTMQSGREEVQQNARGALEMVASDLRGAISAGVEVGNDNAIQVMLPRRWGVVCSQAGTTATVVAFPNIPSQPMPVGADAGLLFQQGNAWLPALPTRATVTLSTPLVVTTACAGRNPTGDLVAFRLEGVDHPAVAAGSTVALYQRVRYDVQNSRGEPWLFRSNGMVDGAFSMQPLAGPVDAAAGGISFTYFTGTPPVALNAAPGGNASTAGLSQVRLRVRFKSRLGSSPQTEFDSATVQLRN